MLLPVLYKWRDDRGWIVDFLPDGAGGAIAVVVWAGPQVGRIEAHPLADLNVDLALMPAEHMVPRASDGRR